MSEIIEFIQQHWKVYLIGAILALVLGFGTAFLIFKVGSTPSDSSGATDSAAVLLMTSPMR